MIAAPYTPKDGKLDVMVTLVETYRTRLFPMALPGPVEANLV